jgi:hypothetical protein
MVDLKLLKFENLRTLTKLDSIHLSSNQAKTKTAAVAYLPKQSGPHQLLLKACDRVEPFHSLARFAFAVLFLLSL